MHAAVRRYSARGIILMKVSRRLLAPWSREEVERVSERAARTKEVEPVCKPRGKGRGETRIAQGGESPTNLEAFGARVPSCSVGL